MCSIRNSRIQKRLDSRSNNGYGYCHATRNFDQWSIVIPRREMSHHSRWIFRKTVPGIQDVNPDTVYVWSRPMHVNFTEAQWHTHMPLIQDTSVSESRFCRIFRIHHGRVFLRTNSITNSFWFSSSKSYSQQSVFDHDFLSRGMVHALSLWCALELGIEDGLARSGWQTP